MVSQISRWRPGRTSDLVRLREQRQESWWSASILAGFVATFAMTVVLVVAYALAALVGQADGPLLLRWFWALVHTPPAQATASGWTWAIVLHLSLGLIWALLYGGVMEPVLGRDGWSGWRTGALFALVPWGLSITLFLPVTGAGFLGTAINAGPLPLLGNLILHLVYGAVLGSFYALARDAALDDGAIDAAANLGAERGAAGGIVGGLGAGAVLGWALSNDLAMLAGTVPVVVAGAVTGAALGALLGSLVGMGQSATLRSARDDNSSAFSVGQHDWEN